MANWLIGSRPSDSAPIAILASVWVCSTHIASSRDMWMALWMTKPAKIGLCSDGVTRLPSQSILGGREQEVEGWGSAAFELGDEEDFRAGLERLEVADLVDLAVDGDGGLLLEVLAQAGIEPVHFLDDAAQRLRRDGELPHPAGVAPA